MSNTHQFALYYRNLTNILAYKKSNNNVEFKDKDLWHRLVRILRVRVGSSIILFDDHNHASVSVLDSTITSKESVVVSVEQIATNKSLEPSVTLMPCLLKKDAFEDIIYAAAQMGVNKIIPILSEKVQRSWLEEKDFTRLFNIMIAACEQSKNFVIPELCKPVELSNIKSLCQAHDGLHKVYFDPAGMCFVDLLKEIQTNKKAEIILFFGPEGGLTESEEKILTELNFITCALTSTILRAREAVIVGLGGVRSMK